MCDYSDTYIFVKGRIAIEGKDINHRANKKLTFKNNAPIRLYMSKINNVFTNSYIVMPMYSLLEYSDNYSITSGSLWNYYRNNLNDAANENYTANYRINYNKT